MPAGRPTDYRPEYAEQAEKLCLLGATDMQLADFFGVSEQTINAWKHSFPKFLESLKDGKEKFDNAVVRTLYRKAIGYEYDSEKIVVVDGQVVRVPVRELVPPSDTAMIFWLKNRRPKEWRDKNPGESADNPLFLRTLNDFYASPKQDITKE
jgi:hypothetical protein